jgi:hypothetical protein
VRCNKKGRLFSRPAIRPVYGRSPKQHYSEPGLEWPIRPDGPLGGLRYRPAASMFIRGFGSEIRQNINEINDIWRRGRDSNPR